jgi:hypothetical protein
MTRQFKPPRLWKEIILTLLVKATFIAVIWAAWFSTPEDVTLDDKKVAAQIFSQQSQKEHNHVAIDRAR